MRIILFHGSSGLGDIYRMVTIQADCTGTDCSVVNSPILNHIGFQ